MERSIDWLVEHSLTNTAEAIARATEHLQNRETMKGDEVLVQTQFTDLGKMKAQTRCGRSTSNLFSTNARKSGFEWYPTEKQELRIQRIIEEFAISSAKKCWGFLTRRTVDTFGLQKYFRFFRRPTWALADEYGFRPLRFAPDSYNVERLFEAIRTGKPALESQDAHHTGSTSRAIDEGIKLYWDDNFSANIDAGYGIRQYLMLYDTTNLTDAVDYIFTNCEEFVENETVEELITPIHTKFNHNNMDRAIQPSIIWFGYKFCENFLQSDQRQVTKVRYKIAESNRSE